VQARTLRIVGAALMRASLLILPMLMASTVLAEPPPRRPARIDAVSAAPLAPAEEIPARGFSLQDFEQFALRNNPTLVQAAARMEAARGRAVQVGLPPNPRVAYIGEEIGEGGSAGKQGLGVRQEIVTGGKRRLAQAAAGAEMNRREQLWAAQRLRVLSDVRTAFFEVLAAQRRIDLSHELLKAAEAAHRSAKKLFQAEEVGYGDVLRTRTVEGRAQLRLNDAQSQHRAAWRRLTSVAGVPGLGPSPLEGSLDVNVPLLDWEDSLRRLQKESPELSAAVADLERARVAVAHATVGRYPNFDVGTAVLYDFGANETLASVEFSTPIPWHDRNQGRIAEAQGQLVAAEQEVQRVLLSLRARLAVVFGRYERARRSVVMYDEKILPDAKTAYDSVVKVYRRGEVGLLELLDVQRSLVSARLERLEAAAAVRREAVRIDALLLSDGLEQAR